MSGAPYANYLTFCLLLGMGLPAFAGDATEAEARRECLLSELEAADPETRVSEVYARCAPPEVADTDSEDLPRPGANSYTGTIAAEQQSLDRSYSLTPHQPNYLLAYSYNRYPNDVTDRETQLDRQEAVLQVSVKFPMWRRILGTDNDLLFSYTAKSWFQAYNEAESKPFRETNYEPEIFFRHYAGQRLGPLQLAGWDIGYNHQSNGRSGPESRSWDRLMGRMALDLAGDDLSLVLRTWYRFPESADGDDNPDIHRYLGYGDVRGIWAPNRNTFTAMWRPGTDRHSFELTWSFPLNNHFRIYTQYFDGYGESLIDYDHRVQRIGIGFAINDFLQAEEP